MPLNIVRQDITKMNTDCIVAAEGHNLANHGWVGSAIARAAGPEYQKACEGLGRCSTGEAVITSGYELPAKYVIHTVGPLYRDGKMGEAILLKSCYEKSLKLAKEHGCRSIAFPVIATGGYGFPKDEGLKVAADTIREFLEENDMDVYLVTYDMETTLLSRELSEEVREYIDDHYVGADIRGTENYREPTSGRGRASLRSNRYALNNYGVELLGLPAHKLEAPREKLEILKKEMPTKAASLESALKVRDESFQQMLFRLIVEKDLKNSQVYTRANISKSHFSKIKGNQDYKPKKETVFALAVALELDIDETKELMMKAGYAISHSFVLDTIVEFFIVSKKYNIMDINYALYDHDQPLLGEKPL